MEKDLIVYRAYFKQTNKNYIGITNDFEKRKKQHSRNAEYGITYELYDAIRTHGEPEYFIIEICDTLESLYESEKKYIEEFNSKISGYNMTLGGQGSFGSIRPKSFEWRERQSTRMLGENNSNYGKKYDDKRREKHSLKMKKYYEKFPEKKAFGNKSCQGLMFINDGIKEKKIKKTDNIPIGFIKGRLKGKYLFQKGK